MSLSQSNAESLRSPDPWLAVNYALIFPGLGQLYSQYWWKGSGLLAIALFLLIYSIWSIFGAYGNTVHGFWAIGLLVVIYSFSILDAYRGTQANYATRITVPKGGRDAWYAVFLSQLLPGLGHLYAQQAALGGLLLIAGLLAAWLANQQPLLAPIPSVIWAFSCYHVYLRFPQRSRRQSTAIALLILGIFFTRFVVSNTPYWIDQTLLQCIVPSTSMVPTLQVGDRLFVRRDRGYEPQTGDIIVFEPPPALKAAMPSRNLDEVIFVKRVIGRPQEEVVINHRQILIEGQLLLEDYIEAPAEYRWGPARVPPLNYFVLGDNRNQSNDSHVWGFLPTDYILGRAYKTYWPPGRIKPLPSGTPFKRPSQSTRAGATP